ncbi:MAG: hypothetical protein ACRCX7_14690, partial [Cetobacterium sp.]|uniref:hypothetical protein n=1 Tax=Cetobacterium sp. TaxID=2071632 RepID=UPI003F389CC9
MKKLLLFIIISIVTLSAPKPSNNQNINKTIAELQIQIKELEQKINKQNEEYLKLKKEVEERIGLTYNIDQIYSTSKSHYELSTEKVEKLYSESFSNYNSMIMAFLTVMGIAATLLTGLFIFVKLEDSGKSKELKKELKEKKDEIEKYIDKNFSNTMMNIKEIIDINLKD